MRLLGTSRVLLFVAIAASAFGIEPGTAAQATRGLIPVDGGRIVYDANQHVYWLADANLAGDARTRAELGFTAGINPDGTMDYPTALHWVDALNGFDHGRGWLGHNNWQLPATPGYDPGCSSSNNGSFGATCTGSDLGNLYSVGLDRTFPDSVVRHFGNTVGPFRNLQPALYWTSEGDAGPSNPDSGSVRTFSFDSGVPGSNTTKYNYLHVLALTAAPIGTSPSDSRLRAYTAGPAAGKAVYDSDTGLTWLLDANLAGTDSLGISGTTTITSGVNGSVLTVPLIDKDGTMLYATATGPGGWIAALNTTQYAGGSGWGLPTEKDLETLFADLGLSAGDPIFEAKRRVGPFRRLQPFFYWACQRDQDGSSQSPCDPSLSPPLHDGIQMEWSFDLDDGFQGTDEYSKPFHVMVYYPAPACGSPVQCCVQVGGFWNGDHCE